MGWLLRTGTRGLGFIPIKIDVRLIRKCPELSLDGGRGFRSQVRVQEAERFVRVVDSGFTPCGVKVGTDRRNPTPVLDGRS